MAINLTVSQLLSALRMGASTEETAEATRLLGYATEAISRHLGSAYEGTAEQICRMRLAIRLAGHLFDQPYASRGTSAMRPRWPTVAREASCCPTKSRGPEVRRRGCGPGSAESGTVGNPVVQISIVGNDLVVEYADASTADVPLPAAISQGNPVVNLSLAGNVLTDHSMLTGARSK